MDVSFGLFSPAPHQISITNVTHLTRANMTFLHSLRYFHFVCPHSLSLTLLPCLGVWNGHTNSFFSLCLPAGIWLMGSPSRKSEGGRRIMLGYFFSSLLSCGTDFYPSAEDQGILLRKPSHDFLLSGSSNHFLPSPSRLRPMSALLVFVIVVWRGHHYKLSNVITVCYPDDNILIVMVSKKYETHQIP